MSNKYTEFARKNYTPGAVIDEMWNEAIIAECQAMNEEIRVAKERERIKAVVSETSDISAELSGRIVFKVSFAGSHAKKKALTKDEKASVMTLPPDVKAKIGGDKPLFESDKYDELVNFISSRRLQFAAFGIPHIDLESAHVADIMSIPAIEDLAVATEAELKKKVEEFILDWPSAIDRAKERLGSLFNQSDYASPYELEKAFRFSYTWMAFGVPEELKQFDVEIYKKAKAKAEMVWKEIEANGVALLRETIMDLVGGLAESLTNKEDGTKRKFYPSSVEKITEFIDSFSKRNICNDEELAAEVATLRDMVSGINVDKLSAGSKGDDAMRAEVRARMETVKVGLEKLTVSANARVIKLKD